MEDDTVCNEFSISSACSPVAATVGEQVNRNHQSNQQSRSSTRAQFYDNSTAMEIFEDIPLINQSSGTYEIVGRWGARVREGASLHSRELGLLKCGQMVKVVGIKRNRARIIEPYQGWVSITASMVEHFVILKKVSNELETSITDDALSRLMSKSLQIKDHLGSINTLRNTSTFKKKSTSFKPTLKSTKERVFTFENVMGLSSIKPDGEDNSMAS